jgi:hypothetical protein
MKPTSTLLLTFALFAAAPAVFAAEWKNLLDGTDLEKHWTTTGNWSLKDGVATLTPRAGEQGWKRFSAYLWSKKTHGDFEVEFDYKIEKDGNSGFYFRVGDVNDPVVKGIEVQISDSANTPATKPLNDHDAGGIIPGVPPTKRADKPPGEWNKFHITSKSDKLTVVLNGETVNEVDLTKGVLAQRPKTGNIGFQDNGMPLSLRNMRVRDLE